MLKILDFFKNAYFKKSFQKFLQIASNYAKFSKIFLKTEAEHVLKMFVKYPKNRASCSYKLRSYKKSVG